MPFHDCQFASVLNIVLSFRFCGSVSGHLILQLIYLFLQLNILLDKHVINVAVADTMKICEKLKYCYAVHSYDNA